MTLLHAEHFLPLVGTSFALERPAGELRLEAVDIFDTAVTEGFSLRFSGPLDRLLPQGIHPMVHGALGRLELFLVPVLGRSADAYTYEAIFNRLRPSARDSMTGGA